MLDRFVTFEGGEGAGKSTQVARLASTLRSLGHAVTVTREPGGSPLAERLRAFLLDPGRPALEARHEALIFAAARSDHLSKLVVPALARGDVVLCDRFADSTYAYQGQAVGESHLEELHRESVAGSGPVLTLLLDIEPSLGLARASRRRRAGETPDRFEAEDLAFHERLRSRFLSLAARESGRFVVVDASREADDVAGAILAAVSARLGSSSEGWIPLPHVVGPHRGGPT